MVGFGYSGGLFFGVEILIYFYFVEMNIDLKNLKDLNRDRFVFFKGYVFFFLYVVLVEKGFISKDEFIGFR